MMGRFKRRFIEQLGFGRSSPIIAQSLVASVPIVISLLAQDTPRFFNNYEIWQLIFLLVVVGTLTFILNFWLLSKAGASTYSPLLHSPKYILVSVIIYFLVAGMAVYIGYFILLYPETRRIVPAHDEILAGAIVSAVYSVLLAGANAAVTLSRTKKDTKERLITSFLSECEKLSSSATEAIDADIDNIIDAASTIKTELSDEPMHDASKLEQELSEWLFSFQQHNTGGKRKMVGGGIKSSSDGDEMWGSLHEQYQRIRKDLSNMQTSALTTVTNEE